MPLTTLLVCDQCGRREERIDGNAQQRSEWSMVGVFCNDDLTVPVAEKDGSFRVKRVRHAMLLCSGCLAAMRLNNHGQTTMQQISEMAARKQQTEFREYLQAQQRSKAAMGKSPIMSNAAFDHKAIHGPSGKLEPDMASLREMMENGNG